MSAPIQPVPSPVADLYFWEAQVSIASNVVGSNKGRTEFQLDSDKSFVLMAYVGSTNYDSYAGDFIAEVGDPLAATRFGVTPPFAPNNFDVKVRINSDWYLNNEAIPQACICSNGYRTGQQFPAGTIFSPMTKFDFEFTNIARTLQLTAAGAAKNLQISFGLMGYFVNNGMMAAFLKSYEQYAAEAQGPITAWLPRFTNVDAAPFA